MQSGHQQSTILLKKLSATHGVNNSISFLPLQGPFSQIHPHIYVLVLSVCITHCLQAMHPDLSQGPHMPPHLPPNSMPLSRGPHHMPPGHPMMGGTNPYGPSAPLPPSMGGPMPPGAMMAMPGNSLPPRPPNSLNTTQLQQLSAQIKAYRMLARSMPPPEALLSIVQGRKPTAAMIGALARGMPGGQASNMGYHSGVPSPIASSQVGCSSGGGGGRDSPAQSNISLYPPSPNASQTGPIENSSQSKPTSSLTQKHSSAPASSPAPNVTLQPGGELPPQVINSPPSIMELCKQAISLRI